MKLHKRHVPVQTANKELIMFLHEWRERHDLTEAEYLSLMTDRLSHSLSWCVKGEREDKTRGRKGKPNRRT